MKELIYNKYFYALLTGIGGGVVAGLLGTESLIFYLVALISVSMVNKALKNSGVL
ncbi:hypothetical protein ACMZ6Z_03785 [Streptococcus pluranimalium]|uniref:hypothetical protein n=1 Tax=Streptococcus pluranimalium TaxID=82348 RepID=UPI0039FD02C6